MPEKVALTEPMGVETEVSPWVTPLAYFLLCGIVAPSYFGQIDIIGQEHLPTEGAVILAPTHRSRWDPIIVSLAAGRWVTGRDLRYMVLLNQTKGLQGWFIRNLGGFPINRDRPTTSSIRYSVELLRRQEVLVLFPEGHIFTDHQIHPIQPGVARIALQAISQQLDLTLNIVPISIRYEYAAPPPIGCNVWVKIGSPLNVRHYQGKSSRQAAQKLTGDLKAALQELHNDERDLQ